MVWVWQQPLKAPQKLVLLALADHADDEGRCWPGIEGLKQKCGMSKSSIINHLNELIELGYVNKIKRYDNGGKRTSNFYILNLSLSPNSTHSTKSNIWTNRVQYLDLEGPNSGHSIKGRNVIETSMNLHSLSTVPVDPVLGVEFMDQNLSLLNRQKNEELRKQVQEIISFLNEKTGKAYGIGKSNFRLVSGRLKDGATTAQCKQIIVRKARKWLGDPTMEDYLRPKTLFNATNFEQYLGELVVPKENEICT